MKIYALAHHKTAPHLTVTTHESRTAAEAFLAASNATGSVVEDEADLRTLAGPVLVAIYNDARPDDSDAVTRFTTKADAARRTFAALEARYQNQAVEAAAPSTVSTSAANDETKLHEENDMPKTKKTKAAKAPKVKKEPKAKAPKVKKGRKGYSAKVKSSGGADSKAKALELISRAKGATPTEIAEKLEISVGSAKNLIWYLRRDGEKIVLGEKTGDRRPYVIG